MIALGSAALLVGYLLLFAAVTGHEFTRNPLLALAGPSSSSSSSSSNSSSSSSSNPGQRASASGITRPGAQIV